MIKRDTLTKFVYQTLGKDLLEKAFQIDTVPNSLQIKGAEDVYKVVVGVSASLEFIEQAIANEAQYCILHRYRDQQPPIHQLS